MAQSDELFPLIKSLDKSEKRYFKLFLRMGTGRAHRHTEELFDNLEKLEEYDEEKFRETLKDPNLRQNLASSKSRLQESILKGLRLMNSGESIDSQLSSTLLDLELMFEKQLVKLARKKLRKAKVIARYYEKEDFLLKLLDWEQRFFVLEPNEDEAEFYIRNEEEEKQCIQRLVAQRNLFRLYEQLRSLIRRGVSPRGKAGIEKFKPIISHPILRKEPPQEQFICRALFHAITGNYAFAQGKLQASWQAFSELLEIWHDREDRIQDHADFYLGSFNNYANLCLLNVDLHEKFLEAIAKLKGVPIITASIKFKFERVAYTQELALRTNFSSFDEGKAFILDLGQWLDRHREKLSSARLLAFYYNITLYYFANSQFSQAQKWLTRILHFPATEARADIRDFARIFQLVLQYELGNLDVQEYLLRSAHRYFNRTQKLHDYEEAILTFVKKEQKNAGVSRKATYSAFEKLQESLLKVRAESEGADPVGFQVMLFWIESHLEGVPLKVYYARKVAEQTQQV